jgi:hypothetical protein
MKQQAIIREKSSIISNVYWEKHMEKWLSIPQCFISKDQGKAQKSDQLFFKLNNFGL